MTKSVVLSLGLLVCFALAGCKVSENKEAVVRREPVVSPYLPRESFTVVDSPQQINDLKIGRVIVKREKDGCLFSVIVISPNRRLTIGAKVELIQVAYHQGYGVWKDFVAVK